MHVDHLTLACLRDCLDNLLGAWVQRVVLPDEHAIALELYAGERHQLLISAHPQHARMLLVPHKPRRGVERATPLLLLLRKWVRSAYLTDVTQPPWERILELHFEGQAGPCRLVAELIGRYSNLILVDSDGDVLEATKHVGPDINRYRVTLPARPYQPPPQPPGRQPPVGISVEEWAALLASADADQALRYLLTSRLLAVSPTAAREIAARAVGAPEALASAAEPEAVDGAVSELFGLLNTGLWRPHIAREESGDVVAFAPYALHQFEREDVPVAVEPVSHISEAMRHYFQSRLTADAYAAARKRVQGMIDDALERVEHALEDVRAQRVDEAEIEALREAGELLLSYQHQVERGASEVTVPDYEGEQRTITLDPASTPVENAQAYFERYRKAKRAAQRIPLRIASLEADRAHLEQLAADLALAESRPEIDAVQEALVEGGWASREPKQSSSGQVKGPRRFEVHDFPVFVGRNADQNERVTFGRGGAEDLWLHVRGRPGAHVIIKRGHREVPEEVVRRAAELAAYYSSMREEDHVAVDVTERGFVQRQRGGHPGQVTYRDEQTLWVEPKKPPPELD